MGRARGFFNAGQRLSFLTAEADPKCDRRGDERSGAR